ncbi:MAG: hypothetical protein ACODAU_13490 [Myxococcota bacterium]
MTFRSAPLLALALLLACEDSATTSEPAPSAGAAEAAEAEQEPDEPLSDDPLEAAIQKAARTASPHMEPDGDFRRGRLDRGKHTDLMFVLKDPFCYAVFAQGGPDVDDLDLFLFDPASVPVLQDSARDHHPRLGIQEPICPPAPDTYRLRVEMIRGHGEFAVRLYRSRP